MLTSRALPALGHLPFFLNLLPGCCLCRLIGAAADSGTATPPSGVDIAAALHNMMQHPVWHGADLCAAAPTQCSAEICDLKPGQVQRLEPGTYYHNKQIFLPAGSAIIGAGINVTHIVACGPPLASRCNLTERRGFLMGDDQGATDRGFRGLA